MLAPVKQLIEYVSKATSDKVQDVRNLLAQEIDPDKETTTIGKALKTLRNLLDPKRSDSVQSSLESAVKDVTTKDGALAKTVKDVVAEAVRPLVLEMDKLAKEIRGQEAAEEALQQTTKKGATYEEEVVEELREWAKAVGAEVHYVGTDNRPGDIVVRLCSGGFIESPLTLVLEIKDCQDARGRKVIADSLSRAMVERSANSAIYLSRSAEGLGCEIGDFAEGATDLGPFVACTYGHLSTALRFLICQQRASALRSAAPEIDSAKIESQIQRIRTALVRVTTINKKVTEVRGGASDIQNEAEALREDIRSALTSIEDVISAAAVVVNRKKAADHVEFVV